MLASPDGFYVNWDPSPSHPQLEELCFRRKKWLADILQQVKNDENDQIIGIVFSTYRLSLAALKEDAPWIFTSSSSSPSSSSSSHLEQSVVPAFVIHGENTSNIHMWTNSDGKRFAKKGSPPPHLLSKRVKTLDDIIQVDTDDEKDEDIELVDYEETRAEPNITYSLPESLRLAEVLPQFPRFIDNDRINGKKKKISRPCIRVSYIKITCHSFVESILHLLTDFVLLIGMPFLVIGCATCKIHTSIQH